MKPALVLLAGSALSLIALSQFQGYHAAYTIAYGVVVTLALSISATFFWLWRVRATPLALGMGFSWAGTCGVLGWWWLFNRLGEPGLMVDNQLLFVFVSSYFVGGVLHFQVIIRSLGRRSALVLLPMLLFVGVATLM